MNNLFDDYNENNTAALGYLGIDREIIFEQSNGHSQAEAKTDIPIQFSISAKVAQRFNQYAQAAYPQEIGGLVRVRHDDQMFQAIDLKIFPQQTSAAYFELDGEEVAKFNLELVRQGRGAEIAEWCSLIHSHPGMSPFMSATDRENITRLAGPGIAFSIICSADQNTENNYYAVHYAQGEPIKMLISNLPFDGSNLTGTDLISDREKSQINQEVDQLCRPIKQQGGLAGQQTDIDMIIAYQALDFCHRYQLIEDGLLEQVGLALDNGSLNDNEQAVIDQALDYLHQSDLNDSYFTDEIESEGL